MTDLGFLFIEGGRMLELLGRAHDGEDPDILFAELWANAEHVEADEDV
jgi:hypothetical protein